MLPGLIDSHVHPMGACMTEFDHPIPDMETIADVLAYVKGAGQRLSEGEWIDLWQVFIRAQGAALSDAARAGRGRPQESRCCSPPGPTPRSIPWH